MIRIAREGWPFIAGAVAVLLMLLAVKALIVAAVWFVERAFDLSLWPA